MFLPAWGETTLCANRTFLLMVCPVVVAWNQHQITVRGDRTGRAEIRNLLFVQSLELSNETPYYCSVQHDHVVLVSYRYIDVHVNSIDWRNVEILSTFVEQNLDGNSWGAGDTGLGGSGQKYRPFRELRPHQNFPILTPVLGCQNQGETNFEYLAGAAFGEVV